MYFIHSSLFPATLVCYDSEPQSIVLLSDICYQIVVRETEDRQLLHFFISTAWNGVKPKRKKALENGPVCRAGFAGFWGEPRWRLLFNGAKDGKPQCTIFAVFEVKKEFWINANELFKSGAGGAWCHGRVFRLWFLIVLAGASSYR